MESLAIYEESYKQIGHLIRQNTTDTLNVDYTKLDRETAGELRRKIDEVLLRRNKEVASMVINKPI